MADPEQIYSEVLAEEQAKGSAAPVAEARAKAARQRAHEGSPHPKEPKWWPGSQPQFEGSEAAPAADAEEGAPVEEAPAAEAPVEEAPAAEAAPPPAEPVAAPTEVAPEQAPAPAQPVQPAAATAPVPVGAAPATAVAPAAAATATLPSGATHGTVAGNRLRPEDSVATDSQFDAQAAMHQRRKMIDELVTTGVPAVAARGSERRGGGAGVLLLYLLIPLIAVFFLVNNRTELAGGAESGGETAEEGGEGSEAGGLTISAANVQFDTDQLEIPADGGALQFVNEDTAEHNVAIYEDDSASKEIFKGEIIPGGQEITYEVPSQEPGEYYFQCDVHPGMNGTVTFK